MFELGKVQHAIGLVYIKNRYEVEDPSGKAADVFPRKNDSLSACAMRKQSAFGQLMFSREKIEVFAERQFAEVERIRHTNLTARLPKKCFLTARSMPANITLKEVCVCVL